MPEPADELIKRINRLRRARRELDRRLTEYQDELRRAIGESEDIHDWMKRETKRIGRYGKLGVVAAVLFLVRRPLETAAALAVIGGGAATWYLTPWASSDDGRGALPGRPPAVTARPNATRTPTPTATPTATATPSPSPTPEETPTSPDDEPVMAQPSPKPERDGEPPRERAPRRPESRPPAERPPGEPPGQPVSHPPAEPPGREEPPPEPACLARLRADVPEIGEVDVCVPDVTNR